jgi:hypothetical protein
MLTWAATLNFFIHKRIHLRLLSSEATWLAQDSVRIIGGKIIKSKAQAGMSPSIIRKHSGN